MSTNIFAYGSISEEYLLKKLTSVPRQYKKKHENGRVYMNFVLKTITNDEEGFTHAIEIAPMREHQKTHKNLIVIKLREYTKTKDTSNLVKNKNNGEQ